MQPIPESVRDLSHRQIMLPSRHTPGCLGLAIVLACAGAHGAPIRYATEHVIAAGDSPAAIAAKAAHTLPRPNQSAWMRLERTFFLHFGVNTFNDVEWGSGLESPAMFNPSQLDAGQWLRAVRQLDGKMLVLVAKHHDGFAMWPSRYTDHSSAASPWRGGKGDLVREVADAARAAGVKLGIYLSPADLYQLKTNPANPAGYYGNGSAKRRSTIPTDPAHFRDDPPGAGPRAGAGIFHVQLRGRRLQPLFPEPVVRTAHAVRPRGRSVVRRCQPRSQCGRDV
jgi:alpha-L-fucosidase